MTSGRLTLFGAVAPLALGMVLAALATPDSVAQEAFSPAELTRLPTDAWLTNGGDLYNRRYSPLTAINRDNVAGLKGVWRTRLGGSGLARQYSGEAEPIVYDGVLYIVTGANDVFAIRIDSGEIVWSYEARLDPTISTICCGWTSRGLGFGEGKVFVGQLDGKLVALDRHTGEVVWSVQTERWQEGYTITSAPRYYDGMVITGYAGAEYAARGRVKAYAADDGSHVWTFYTVPGPGEFGHDTWPDDNEVWRHGGATVWQTPAVDPELGLMYFSTGNPGPDFNGAVRAGDNLFSVSMVAINVTTGEYRWHFQQIRHDLWDFDAANPVVLFDVEIDGVVRKAISEINKNGYNYILDRVSGEPLLGMDYVPVPQEPRQATADTQPIPRGVTAAPVTIDIAPEGAVLLDEHVYVPFWSDEDGEGRVVGTRSGANWPPSSYDPQRRLLYVCVNERLSHYRANEDETDMPPLGERYMGGSFGGVGMPTTGVLAALDVTTNTPAWRQRWPDRCYSGSVATAGDLLFIGRSDGRFMAYDSDNGMPLWEFQTGAGVNTTPAIFEYEGEQYVAVFSAGNAFASSPRGDSVWLFSLNGTLDPVEAPPPSAFIGRARGGGGAAPAADPTAPAGTGAPAAPMGLPNLDNGATLYGLVCELCHGADGQGGHADGAPITPGLTLTEAVSVVTDGRNTMAGFGGALSADELRDVSAYAIGLVEE
ncbi:MAG: PQQ-binding-like beta-propeller repeat protein [Rhodospirillales bacterium]|nr:PQQ-binding-like beta-propeller repeat protein [Rhodospirillales bacterium]